MASAASAPTFVLRLASSEEGYASFAALSRQYVNWLGEDLDFQGFEAEMARLPGSYGQPQGCIILASLQAGVDSSSAAYQDVGCVALRPLAGTQFESCCEMKRLFVVPKYGGRGIGRALVQRVLQEASAKGYACMVLDTLQRLTAANKLYAAAGFEQIAAYYHNPLPEVVYWYTQLCDPLSGPPTTHHA